MKVTPSARAALCCLSAACSVAVYGCGKKGVAGPATGELNPGIRLEIAGCKVPLGDGMKMLAVVRYDWFARSLLVRAEKNGKWGFVNMASRVAIPFEFSQVGDFEEGLAEAHTERERGFIDRKGNWAIGPFEHAASLRRFSEGLAAYGVRTGWRQEGDERFAEMSWGFINKKGAVVIKARFEDALDFGEGLAPVKVGGRWGYVDSRGKVVIRPKYDSAWVFSEGLAPAKSGGKWGYIGRDGEFVIAPTYWHAGSFCGGRAAVSSSAGETPALVDYFGNYIGDADFKAMWEKALHQGSEARDRKD